MRLLFRHVTLLTLQPPHHHSRGELADLRASSATAPVCLVPPLTFTLQRLFAHESRIQLAPPIRLGQPRVVCWPGCLLIV